jgi:hypothetical protein
LWFYQIPPNWEMGGCCHANRLCGASARSLLLSMHWLACQECYYVYMTTPINAAELCLQRLGRQAFESFNVTTISRRSRVIHGVCVARSSCCAVHAV